MSEHDEVRRLGVMMEAMQSELQRFAEAMADVPAKVDALVVDVDELKSDMKVVKAAVTDQSRVLQDHERRLTALESRAS